MCSEVIMTRDSSFISTSSWIHAWISLNSASTGESPTEEHLPLKTNVFNDENDQDCGLRHSPPCWSLWCVLKITALLTSGQLFIEQLCNWQQCANSMPDYTQFRRTTWPSVLTLIHLFLQIVDAFLGKMSILNQERLGVLHGKSGWMH